MGIVAGDETRVNTFTAGAQVVPEIAALEGGGWVVTWFSFGQDGFQGGIYQQRYDGAGAPVGGETQVNTYVAGSQTLAQVTAIEGGGWVVAWESDGQDGDRLGVYQQAYDANGAEFGEETRVNTHTTHDQDSIRIDALEGGGWVVTWNSYGQDGDNEGIYQQAYNVDGSALGVETQVNTYTTDAQFDQQLTALAGGGWVVTWTSTGQDGSSWGVYQQAYNADGTPLGVETRVNTHTASDQGQPRLAALEDGGWVAVWMSYSQDGSTGGIYQQVFDAGGAPVGVETR
ncbi:MAG TPA: hypothetical protein VMF90_15800, partial [Rhizobiaceae bacterium]|nr:hypothetical protein [Rhizobiaceae bacterium]